MTHIKVEELENASVSENVESIAGERVNYRKSVYPGS